MILFRLKKLETRLAAGEVTEKAGLYYLLTWIIFFAVYTYLPGSTGPYTNDWWEFGAFVLCLAIAVWAISFFYKINHRNGGRDFLKKFLSLALVIGLRFSIIYGLLWLGYKIFMFYIPDNLYLFLSGFWIENIADFVHSATLTVIYFSLLVSSLKRVLQMENPSAASQLT